MAGICTGLQLTIAVAALLLHNRTPSFDPYVILGAAVAHAAVLLLRSANIPHTARQTDLYFFSKVFSKVCVCAKRYPLTFASFRSSKYRSAKHWLAYSTSNIHAKSTTKQQFHSHADPDSTSSSLDKSPLIDSSTGNAVHTSQVPTLLQVIHALATVALAHLLPHQARHHTPDPLLADNRILCSLQGLVVVVVDAREGRRDRGLLREERGGFGGRHCGCAALPGAWREGCSRGVGGERRPGEFVGQLGGGRSVGAGDVRRGRMVMARSESSSVALVRVGIGGHVLMASPASSSLPKSMFLTCRWYIQLAISTP